MLDSRDVGGIQGAPLFGADNEKIGNVAQVFVDPATGSPNWVTIKTGFLGRHESFVPLANATWDGEVLRTELDKETVLEAPRLNAEEGLSPHNEEALNRYFGLSDVDSDGGTARPPEEYPERTELMDQAAQRKREEEAAGQPTGSQHGDDHGVSHDSSHGTEHEPVREVAYVPVQDNAPVQEREPVEHREPVQEHERVQEHESVQEHEPVQNHPAPNQHQNQDPLQGTTPVRADVRADALNSNGGLDDTMGNNAADIAEPGAAEGGDARRSGPRHAAQRDSSR
ncbi:PRC-barrel domain-containing protein [Mycetocola zhujimingii]|uniref:PRC-barrel domain-containing protein n=1 Tax=Mycetocola zhujimingii TaxID=2079792 RepID=UPI000D35C54F|nr:PRC-barrel domain-containing protein [Mycetocola zhujimingii]AWB87723.1 hypothetical protein C3E77_14690 [Mycetocola zhujimingii]